MQQNRRGQQASLEQAPESMEASEELSLTEEVNSQEAEDRAWAVIMVNEAAGIRYPL